MYKNIMVPLDGSALAECVLPHVETIAKGCGITTVTFVHAVEPVRQVSGESGFSPEDWKRFDAQHKAEAQNYINQVVARTKWEGVTVKSAVRVGRAAETLANYAEKNGVDLVVIATHGRSGLSRWVWGSVADKLLRSLTCPLLMVRAKE